VAIIVLSVHDDVAECGWNILALSALITDVIYITDTVRLAKANSR